MVGLIARAPFEMPPLNPRRRTLLSAVLAGAASALPWRPGVAASENWEEVVAAAKKEGELTVYSAAVGQGQHVRIGKLFETAYGIPVRFLEARASEIRERIRSEQSAGRFIADVSHDGTTTSALQARDGVFQHYGALPNLPLLKPPFVASEFLVPAFALTYAVLINTRLVKPEEEPRSWFDLTDPRWKGRILSDDMRALGGGGVMFSVLEDKLGRDFHARLAKNQLSFSRDVRASEQRVARGEFPIWIPFTSNDILRLTGLPVKLINPVEGLPYIGYELAMLKNAPHPHAARVFMNFFLSPAAQGAYADDGLSSVTGLDRSGEDATLRALHAAKLLGTTDPYRIDEMLALAKEIYA